MLAQRHTQSSPYAYSEEPIHEIIDEIAPILARHWEEVARNQDKIPLAVGWDTYRLMTEAGTCSTVTAREDGRLVGYVINLVAPSLHYMRNVFSVNDAIYLDPACRGRGVADAMMDFCEALLRDKYGVEFCHMHMKMAHDFSPWMKKRGYVPIDMIWEKALC